MNTRRFSLCLVIFFAVSCGKKEIPERAANVSPPVNSTNVQSTSPAPNQFVSNEIPASTVIPEESSKVPGQEIYDAAVAVIRRAQNPAAAEEAMKLFREAAELGNPAAQHALGVSYFTGLGAAKSTEEALAWFHKSAAQGYADAEFRIASIYIRGDGVPADEAKALEFLRKAAERGHTEAQYNLATLYSTGQSVPKDAAEAAKWFRKAAEAGHPTAQSNVGVLYASGEVLEKNMEQAVQWWRKAAEQGQPSAQFNLAQSLFEGKSVAKDLVEAYKWYHLAAEQGDRDAARMRNALSVELRPSEIADALKRSREFNSQLHARREAEKEKLF